MAWIVPSAIPATLLLTLAVLAPFAVFVLYGFWHQDIFLLDKAFSLDQYDTVLGDSLYRTLLARTLVLGLVVTLIALPIAYTAAYAVSFKLKRGRNFVLFALVIATLGSYLAKIISWKVVLAPAGIISEGLQTVGIISAPLEGLSSGWFPVLVALVHLMLPLAFLPIYAAMQSIDADVPRAARDLGASPMAVGTRVMMPLCRRGLATAFVLVFVLSCGDYVTPQLLSGGSGTMIGALIYQQFGITRDWPLGSALSIVLILSIILSLALIWLFNRGLSAVAARRRPHRSRSIPLPTPRIGRRRLAWAGPFIGFLLAFLYLPLVILVGFSFVDRSIVALPITGLTTRWYGDALSGGAFGDALVNSLEVAGLVVLLCLLVGVPLAFALVRRRFRLRRPLEALVVLPLLIPGIVIGFSLLTAFSEAGMDLGLISAAAGQTALLLPLMVLVVVARLDGFDREIELAARDLGCTPFGVLRRVMLPLIAPTLIAASIIVMAQSLDEFVITLYTAGDRTTLPILMWSILQRMGLTPVVNAIATILLVGTTLTLIVGFFAMRRRGGTIGALRRGLAN